ncbi:hypothetical protein K7G98_27430, partial [Saccharothrix sp. MB29]|nr:hypothetical protein [Saccharothrix sp. MB29]
MSASHPSPDYERFSRRFHADDLSPADRQQWYATRLTTVLRHVTTRSDFYRERLAGFDVAAITPADLHRLPFTTKQDLRTAMHSILSGPVSEAAIYYETTGTTGAATPCPRSANEIAESNLHVEQSWRRLFADRFGSRMPLVALMGPSELYAFGDTFGEVAQRLGSCHAKIWPESSRVGFKKALRLLKELRAEVVVCAPALCLSLAKAALHYGYDPRTDFDIGMFLVLGEICTPELSDNIASIWGARAVPTLYGSQEALAIATGCAQRRLHLSDPNYLVEIVDPGGDAVLGGTGTGELCLTMLIDGSKPLIRYRTGDLVTVTDERCACGGAGSLIDVHGRVADRIAIGRAELHPAELEAAILRDVAGCLGYQVVIDDGDDGESVTVHLDLLPGIAGAADAFTAGVADRLRAVVGVPV